MWVQVHGETGASGKNSRATEQCKYFEGYNFRGFCFFPAKRENYFHENEWTPTVMWLNYACDP